MTLNALDCSNTLPLSVYSASTFAPGVGPVRGATSINVTLNAAFTVGEVWKPIPYLPKHLKHLHDTI